jgi:RimJ/RimL family protein N-acetyltransferase
MPSLPCLDHPIADRGVALRDAAERDIPEILIAYQDDPELHLHLGQEKPPSGAQLGSRAEREAAARAAGAGATLTITEADSDVCRGQVDVHEIDWDHACAEVGIWLAPDARGRGLARRALRLASEWLLEECGIERVQIRTEPDNEAMLRAAQAAGFVRERTLRGYLHYRGRREDSTILTLPPSEQ